MKITNVGRQMTVPQDMKELVEKKLSKLDKYFYNESEATVTFSKKRNKESLEVTISAAGTLFRAEVEEDTFRDALDRVIDTIERQIRKNKTRLAKRIRQNAVIEAVEAEHIVPEEEDPEYIIRTKTFPFKPMTPEEAIMQMNLLGHEFFVFVDIDTEETCVVYARRDGDYGLITPEK